MGHEHLREYLGIYSKILNPYLRKEGNMDYNYLHEKKKDQINASLDSATPYNNSLAYRIDEPFNGLSFELFALWFMRRINRIIEIPNFLSTTCDPKKYFKRLNILYRISTNNNSSGKVISSIVEDCAHEGEILFKSNTKFRILGINKHCEFIELKEVENEFDADIILYENFYLTETEIAEYIKSKKILNCYENDL